MSKDPWEEFDLIMEKIKQKNLEIRDTLKIFDKKDISSQINHLRKDVKKRYNLEEQTSAQIINFSDFKK